MMRLQSTLRIGQFYAQALVQLLIEPGQFFKEAPQKSEINKVIGFMVICCGFFSVASLLTGAYSRPVWQMGIVFFAGAAGMILIASFLGYIAMVMIVGKRVCFPVVFSIYVYSYGVTLFISWLPFFLWFAEPWKWWLIYIGFKNTCCFSWKQAVSILALSMSVQFFLLYSAYLAFAN